MYSNICKEFIRNLDRILQNNFLLKYHLIRENTLLIRVFWECNGHFDHWFSNTEAFLCSIWNLLREKFYPLGSSDLVLHISINRFYGNTFIIYLFIYLILYKYSIILYN